MSLHSLSNTQNLTLLPSFFICHATSPARAMYETNRNFFPAESVFPEPFALSADTKNHQALEKSQMKNKKTKRKQDAFKVLIVLLQGSVKLLSTTTLKLAPVNR